MMTMVIIPVTIMAMVIIPVVNHRAKIVLGSGFADWRDGSGERRLTLELKQEDRRKV